jgi:hypothetical protein
MAAGLTVAGAARLTGQVAWPQRRPVPSPPSGGDGLMPYPRYRAATDQRRWHPAVEEKQAHASLATYRAVTDR